MFTNIKRILIAEDSPQWQKFHTSLLINYKKVKIEYSVASSAKEALELVENNLKTPFDLILSDLQMETDFLPTFAGEWFIEKVKSLPECKDTKIVIVSASYNIGFLAHSLGVDYLSKRSLVANQDSYYFMLDENLS